MFPLMMKSRRLSTADDLVRLNSPAFRMMIYILSPGYHAHSHQHLHRIHKRSAHPCSTEHIKPQILAGAPPHIAPP